MDEGFRVRRLQQRIAVAGGDIDEIAEHIVELDLQRIDACLVAIAGLKLRDDLAAVAAQRAGLIQRLVPAIGDEAAIAGKGRQAFGEGIGKVAGERCERFVPGRVEGLDGFCHVFGQAGLQAGESLCECAAFTNGVCNGLKVAWAAPLEPDPGTGALQIGHGFQAGAHIGAKVCFRQEEGDRVIAPLDDVAVAFRPGEAVCEETCAGGGQRAVDCGEQRAFSPALYGLVDFETGAGGRVDGERACLRAAARRVEADIGARLREAEIVQKDTAGGKFCLAETAKTIEGSEAVGGLQRRFPG